MDKKCPNCGVVMREYPDRHYICDECGCKLWVIEEGIRYE